MEDFVSFELAKKLKEKGFNDECHAYYEPLKHCLNFSRVFKTNSLAENYNCIAAPTISQVLKWLREEKRIDAGAVWDNRDGKWVGYINEMDMPNLVGEYVLPNTHDTYEAATIASIEYVLDNFI